MIATVPRVALVAVLVLALAGCGDEADTDPAATATAPPSTTQEPDAAAAAEPAPAPRGRTVRFRAADGVALRGSLVPGGEGRSPAVVLVHESNGGPEQFDGLVPYLREQGIAALTYTSRSGPGRMDETRNAQDIAGAVRALRRRPEVDPERVAVVGASIGATSAAYLAFSPRGRDVRATVGLSPGTFLDDPPAAGRPRDVLLLADAAEHPSAEFLAEGESGITTRVAPIDGHGVALLEDARVRADVLQWLGERLDA